MFGENFPYTNFHDLNLDWIIKAFKEGQISIEEAKASFDAAMSEITNIADAVHTDAENASESATTAIDAAQTAEEAAQTALQASIKRRYFFIGDSYAQGWTPDGTFESWPTKVKNILNISNDDYYLIAQGGSGFWVNDTTDNRYIPNMIQRGYDLMTNPNTITDIVMGFGYNEINAWDQDSRLKTVAETVLTKIKTLFPHNPRIWLFGLGYTTNHANQFKLMRVYNTYGSFPGFGFIKLTEYLTEKAYFSSDGHHPVASGQTKLAQAVSQMLNYGSNINGFYGMYVMNEKTFFKNIVTNNNFSGPVYSYRQDDRLIITCPTASYLATTFEGTDNISLSRAVTKIGKYENTDITGFHNWSSQGQMFPCDIIYRVSGNNSYYHVPGYINIAPDTDEDNNLYVWVSIFDVNDGHNDYLQWQDTTATILQRRLARQ